MTQTDTLHEVASPPPAIWAAPEAHLDAPDIHSRSALPPPCIGRVGLESVTPEEVRTGFISVLRNPIDPADQVARMYLRTKLGKVVMLGVADKLFGRATGKGYSEYIDAIFMDSGFSAKSYNPEYKIAANDAEAIYKRTGYDTAFDELMRSIADVGAKNEGWPPVDQVSGSVIPTSIDAVDALKQIYADEVSRLTAKQKTAQLRRHQDRMLLVNTESPNGTKNIGLENQFHALKVDYSKLPFGTAWTKAGRAKRHDFTKRIANMDQEIAAVRARAKLDLDREFEAEKWQVLDASTELMVSKEELIRAAQFGEPIVFVGKDLVLDISSPPQNVDELNVLSRKLRNDITVASKILYSLGDPGARSYQEDLIDVLSRALLWTSAASYTMY